MLRPTRDARGSVLIMVLWALSLLAVFAIEISGMARDKIAFLARSERVNILRGCARSGVYKAIAMIRSEEIKNKQNNPLQRMKVLFDNPASFERISFVQADVSVFNVSGRDQAPVFGVSDEGSRLNINKVSLQSLQRLLIVQGGVSEDQAFQLASAIYDWREFGETQAGGFSNNVDYYDSLQFPYSEKKADFEILDEIRLVAGMTGRIYDTIKDYITIYGEGSINMNSVTSPVLQALGFSEEQARALEKVRLGQDGVPGTLDDIYFQDPNTMIEKVGQVLALKPEELELFRRVADKVSWTSAVNLYRMQSRAQWHNRDENIEVTCVFDANNDKIIYWRQK